MDVLLDVLSACGEDEKGLDLAQCLFNGEELIHEAELESLILLLEFLVIKHALHEDDPSLMRFLLLVAPNLVDPCLYDLIHQCLIEQRCTVVHLLELVLHGIVECDSPLLVA